MQVKRRAMIAAGMAGVAAASVSAGGAVRAQNAAPQAAAQAPGFYRFKVGDIEVTLINDGVARRPLDAGFVRNAEFDAVKAALAASFQPTDTITIPFTTTVLKTGSRLILIDSGNGMFGAPTSGRWHENFKAAGYTPDQVDTIIVSHFHGDHINGIRDKDGAPVFKNAKISVSAPEWAFWMDDAQMSRAPEGMRGAFQNVRRVFAPVAGEITRYESGQEVAPGVTAMAAPGHTPGHTAFVVASGAGKLLVWSDTTNKPELFVRNPEWQAVFDMDGNQAAATRKRMLDMAAAERMPVTGYHFPFPALGYIAKDGAGYAFVPAFWQPAA